MRIKADVRPYGCSTINELAESLGYSRGAVSGFLRGQYRAGPKLRKLLLERLNQERETAKTRNADAIRRISSLSKGRKVTNAKGRRKA